MCIVFKWIILTEHNLFHNLNLNIHYMWVYTILTYSRYYFTAMNSYFSELTEHYISMEIL